MLLTSIWPQTGDSAVWQSNENMQVMGGSVPIKGLYAAGDTTGSRYINRGGEKIEIINDMTWAIASGYLAGENIGKLLNSV